MTINEYQKKYSDIKEAFLEGKAADISSKHAAVIRNWQESVAAGAIAHTQALDISTRDNSVFERLDDLYKCHIAYFDQYYEARNKALSTLGCAIFYLDDHFSVFAKGGNSEFIAVLKARGIRIGTNLSPKNIGIFAGNISPLTPNANVVTMGAAHFSDVLKDVVCIARYGESPEFASFKSNNVIFIPIALYSRSLRASISFLLESEDYSYKRSPMYPQIRQKFELLEKSAQYDSDILLLVDQGGQIVFFNGKFEKEFGKLAKSSIGEKLVDVLPGAVDIIRALNSGINLSSKELLLPDARGVNHFYYMDLAVMKDSGRVIGARVTMQPAKKRNELTSKYVGNISRFTFDDIIGNSPVIARAKQYGQQAAQNDGNVLITGQSGTGKELFAHSIHSASARAGAPFIPINCGAIPRELIGTELFGYEGGSFTGANKTGSPGKIEIADGGTLFLDEIGEMPLDMQVFLLRFLEDGTVTRIGGKSCQSVDVRVISATNRDLLECVRAGTFRLDLYYRLNVMHIELPPLCEHTDDILPLTKHFINVLAPKYGKCITDIAPATLSTLRKYSWPGNTRQLRNVIERCIINTDDGHPLELDADTADKMRRDTGNTIAAMQLPRGAELPNYEQYTEQMLRRLMIEFNGNKSKVAQALGISRGTLYKRLEDIGYYKK